MAAGVAHEINNPLTGVLGFSQMLLEKENVRKKSKRNSGSSLTAVSVSPIL